MPSRLRDVKFREKRRVEIIMITCVLMFIGNLISGAMETVYPLKRWFWIIVGALISIVAYLVGSNVEMRWIEKTFEVSYKADVILVSPKKAEDWKANH